MCVCVCVCVCVNEETKMTEYLILNMWDSNELWVME